MISSSGYFHAMGTSGIFLLHVDRGSSCWVANHIKWFRVCAVGWVAPDCSACSCKIASQARQPFPLTHISLKAHTSPSVLVWSYLLRVTS